MLDLGPERKRKGKTKGRPMEKTGQKFCQMFYNFQLGNNLKIFASHALSEYFMLTAPLDVTKIHVR